MRSTSALADRSERIGPPSPAESYLSIEAILDAAVTERRGGDPSGVRLPLRERGVREGRRPTPASSSSGRRPRRSSRSATSWPPGAAPRPPACRSSPARELAIEGDTADLAAVGFPLMLKAAAGGGGRGMRRVESPDGVPDALAAARREALSAFGDGTIYVERVIAPARHVEVQLLGDRHGGLAALGERDCSVQRRHQKLVEESPSPAVDEATRAALLESARRVAGSVEFHNAATVEFLLDADGSHYFLEMNTRLQVEHGVTELVTGLDLVAWQIRVAAGERLPESVLAPAFHGHAIEVRLYAEDPYAGFRPAAGRITAWQMAGRPRHPGRRRGRGRHRPAAGVRPAPRQAHGPRRRSARGRRAPPPRAGRDPHRRGPDRCRLPALAGRRRGVRRRGIRHRAHRGSLGRRPTADRRRGGPGGRGRARSAEPPERTGAPMVARPGPTTGRPGAGQRRREALRQ